MRAVVLASAIAGSAWAAAGCGASGDEGAQRGPLRWHEPPRQVAHPTLRGDTVLAGTVVNASLRPVRLQARDLRVVTSGGRRLRANGAFLPGYVRALMPRNRAEELPDYEARRLGRVLELRPGQRLPLNVSWRGPGAATIRVAGSSLPVPGGGS